MSVIVTGILAFVVALIGVLVNLMDFSQPILFYLVGTVTILAALSVISQRNPVYSVISLVVTLVSVAVLFLLMGAEFLAAAQVIVYAGAIMVLFLFVIMLLNLGNDNAGEDGGDRLFMQKRTSTFLGGTLFVVIGLVIKSSFFNGTKGIYTPEVLSKVDNTELVGKLLFTEYLLPFEITSVLLFAAVLGTIVLAKKKI